LYRYTARQILSASTKKLVLVAVVVVLVTSGLVGWDTKGTQMNGTRSWLIEGMIGLGIVGVAVVLGVQQYQHRQRLAAFQTLVREGSGQAAASLGMINAGSMDVSKIKPECDRFVQTQRDLIAKVVAVDMSNAPEEQQEYVTLLNAENDLMMAVGADEKTELRTLKMYYTAPVGEYCNALRNQRDRRSSVREKAKTVFTLEKKFQATCVTRGLTCEPEFMKYQQNFAKEFNDEDVQYYRCDR
jgi:Zn-dependent alcohol dehydrogenase